MKKALLKIAIRKVIKKIKRHPQYKHYIHYSFVVQNNKIIVYAPNTNLNPPVHYGYKDRPDLKKSSDKSNYRPKSHSEINAYKKAIKITDKDIFDKDKPFEIINIRFNKTGEIRLASPCFCCFNLLTELGCSKFYCV